MTQFRSIREKVAYQAGLAAGRAESADDGQPLKRSDVERMSPDEVTRNWPQVQAALRDGFAEEDE